MLQDDEKNGTKMPDVPAEGDDGGGKKDKKKEKKKKGKKKGKKGGKKEDDEFEKSEFLQQIQDSTLWYSSLWERRDEADNFEQKHDPEIIKSALRCVGELGCAQEDDSLLTALCGLLGPRSTPKCKARLWRN